MKTSEELGYLLKLSRPRFWLYLVGPALLGMVLASGSTGQLLSIENFLLFLYFLIPANIMLYGVNDYFDRKIDRKNPKKGDKEESYSPSFLVNLAIGISTALVVPIGLFLPQRSLFTLLGFLFLSVGYSAPPLRFKTKPFLDSLSNGLYILPFIVTYTAITGSFPPLLVVAAGWLWAMAMHTFSAIPDIGPDREAGIETTATFLGRKKTYFYCAAVWTLSGVFASLWNLWIGLVFFIYPVLCLGFYLSDLSDSEAYWYYPYINAFTGMVLTLAGLWVLVHG